MNLIAYLGAIRALNQYYQPKLSDICILNAESLFKSQHFTLELF